MQMYLNLKIIFDELNKLERISRSSETILFLCKNIITLKKLDNAVVKHRAIEFSTST